MRIRFLLLPLAMHASACAPRAADTVQPTVAPAELVLADGGLRVIDLARIQGRILREGAGQPPDTVVARLAREVYRPWPRFWNGYLGDEADFREWAVKLLEPGHPIHARLAPFAALALDRRFSEGVDWIVRTTGRRPAGTWYIVFGPGWTDMGGLSGIGMVADFTKLVPDSAAVANLLPHELTHQVQGGSSARAGDPDAGTVLERIVNEGFASYVAWVYGGDRHTPAQALMYRDPEWAWALAHERELSAAVAPLLASRERKHLDLVASRGDQVVPGAPGAVGYFLGFRIVQAYVANRGAESWKEISDLPVAEVVARSGYRW